MVAESDQGFREFWKMDEIPPLRKPPGYRDPDLPIQMLPPRTAYKKRRNCCLTCCCCLCVSLVFFTLFFISFGGFFYLWCEPRLPEFKIKSFRFDNFNVTNSGDSAKLNTKVTVKIEFRNTNENMKLEYDKISMIVNGEGGLNLGEGAVPGFVQRKHNVTTVKFNLKGKQLVSKQEAKELTNQFKSKTLKLNTEVTSGIGVMFHGWNTGKVGVKVTCGDTTLKKIQDGNAPKCRIYMFRLLYV